jgi:hypothetical protein
MSIGATVAAGGGEIIGLAAVAVGCGETTGFAAVAMGCGEIAGVAGAAFSGDRITMGEGFLNSGMSRSIIPAPIPSATTAINR